MNRLLTFAAALIFAGATIAGGTGAFFSDSETSTGNIFVAGALDLKVDQTMLTYNGEECEDVCVAATSTNLLSNGGFETPIVATGAGWDIYPDGTVGLGWRVAWEPGQPTTFGAGTRPVLANLEFHRGVNGWNHAEGLQHAELDTDWDGPSGALNGEPSLVSIYQDIVTVPGKKYELRYAHGARPNTTADQNTLHVRIGGVLVDTKTKAGGNAPIVWDEYTETFTATSTTTRIEFAAGGPTDGMGVFLDNVRLYAVNCTTTNSLPYGATCSLWEDKDLTTSDHFFDFPDVKPGDQGRNVISLHVFNNPAYACLIVSAKEDYDNTHLEPELDAGDTDTDDIGELSQFLHVVTWTDTNANGIYEPGLGEVALGQGTLNTLGVLSAMDSVNGMHLAATTTAYVGLAWCAGTQTVNGTTGVITCDPSSMTNIAQSDSFSAHLTAYAEQMQHNDTFSCANVQLP